MLVPIYYVEVKDSDGQEVIMITHHTGGYACGIIVKSDISGENVGKDFTEPLDFLERAYYLGLIDFTLEFVAT